MGLRCSDCGRFIRPWNARCRKCAERMLVLALESGVGVGMKDGTIVRSLDDYIEWKERG